MRTGSAILVFLFLSTTCNAQTPDTQPWLTDSSRAIQFGVGGYFNLSTFDSKALSVKFHLFPLSAIRVGLAMRGNTSRSDKEVKRTVGDSLISAKSSSNRYNEDLSFELTSQYMLFLDTQSDLFLFIGSGPIVTYSYQGNDDGDWTRTWGLGVEGAIGAEWFATHRISFHAEYRAAALYTISKDEYTYPSQFETTNQQTISWELRSGRVLFGLSAYF
jgi:hypothetical protein